MPARILLDIPFTEQAPDGDWSSPFNEACEESILIMVDHYQKKQSLSSTSRVKEKILQLVDWEQNTYEFHEDTSAEITAQTARDYFGINATVSYDVSIDSIKQELSTGNPVLVPVYGKALQNSHYRNGGSYYHMILLVGYEDDLFFSHDPGTRYGAQYPYDSELLINAIHNLRHYKKGWSRVAFLVIAASTCLG